MKIGELFYWKGKVLCEFMGHDLAHRAKYKFRTTNGGFIYLSREEVFKDITKEERK